MLSTIHLWSHLNFDFSLQGRPFITNPFYLIDTWMGFLGGAVGKEYACQTRRPERQRFVPWVRKIPWRRKWQLAPTFLSREFRRQRSLAGYSPWGHKVPEMSKSTHTADIWILKISNFSGLSFGGLYPLRSTSISSKLLDLLVWSCS